MTTIHMRKSNAQRTYEALLFDLPQTTTQLAATTGLTVSAVGKALRQLEREMFAKPRRCRYTDRIEWRRGTGIA